ncbi:MAG: tetratricopeptide repeat protein [Paludibacter sp.]
MTIIYQKEDFLYTLFPELANGNDELIISTLTDYYSFGAYKPTVVISGDVIRIEIDTVSIQKHEADYRRVVALCEKGNYTTAKPILTKLIEQNPTNSEYYRIMGQILSDEGNQEEAINCLIDALRWDANNNWALTMMGNIFANYKADLPTAMKYYQRAILLQPEDFTTIYNVGALHFKEGNFTEAKNYLYQSLSINNTYPNSHHVLALMAMAENDIASAFYSATQSLRYNKRQDELYRKTLSLMVDAAQKLIQTDTGRTTYRNFRKQLETECGKTIDIVKDATIVTAAKCEFAEVHHRDRHIVLFKPDYKAVEHLIMHELCHLQLATEARKAGLNKLFTSDATKRTAFSNILEPTIQRLRKMRVDETEIGKFINGLFDGINLQAYNAPIDLFIEDMLYSSYPELRPYQFISLYSLIEESLNGITDKGIVEITPKDIFSKSKIYNMVSAMQFRDLFGIDLTAEFGATKSEQHQANAFYSEYTEYKSDRQPAEEYELVQHWAADLGLDGHFRLVDEKEFYAEKTTEKSLFNLFDNINIAAETTDTDSKESDMRRFLATQKANGTNSDIVIFMVEALHYFEKLPVETIKTIAVKIALQGAQGYDPLKQYTSEAFPGKVFGGYQMLAYYYVSFALALPEVLMELNLPYHEEYLLARGMKNGKN